MLGSLRAWRYLNLILLLAIAPSLSAQGEDEDDFIVEHGVFGSALFPNAIYGGMLTYHLNENFHDERFRDNHLIAGVYKSTYLATLINSHNERIYIAAAQRQFRDYAFNGSRFDTALGYRVGLVYGYDEKAVGEPGKLPVLPIGSLLYQVRYRDVGVEFAYTGILLSVSLFVTL